LFFLEMKMPSIETKANAGDMTGKQQAALAIAKKIATVEDKAINRGTKGIYRLRMRHPYLYGFAAFVLGGGLISIFTMTTYTNWAYEGVNLSTALHQIIFGGLGGGIVAVILAFAYAGSIGRTREGMTSTGINPATGPNSLT
jgi:uncharacterized iron-regulated membrane protein